jgi:hypothetical protein
MVLSFIFVVAYLSPSLRAVPQVPQAASFQFFSRRTKAEFPLNLKCHLGHSYYFVLAAASLLVQVVEHCRSGHRNIQKAFRISPGHSTR